MTVSGGVSKKQDKQEAKKNDLLYVSGYRTACWQVHRDALETATANKSQFFKLISIDQFQNLSEQLRLLQVLELCFPLALNLELLYQHFSDNFHG
jgi:hypothetical protein